MAFPKKYFKNFIQFSGFIAAGAVLFILEATYPGYALKKISYTFFALAGIYFLTHIIAEAYIRRNIKEKRAQYSFRRSIFFAHIVLFLIAVIAIWVENIQTLMVAYGLVGAGIAISLQDFFKNLVGGIILFTKRPYNIGDRIEVASKHGDVIDIGLLYTSVMEIREWVDGDQVTGRLSKIPNGQLLTATINNYTRDYDFIWDEMSLPVTYESNWHKAKDIIYNVADTGTKEFQKSAKAHLSAIREKYYIRERDTEPSIYLSLTDNWVNFRIRYVCPTYERREVAHNLSEALLEALEKEKDIEIASATSTIKVANPKQG